MEFTKQQKSEIVQMALKQLVVSTEFKKPRMDKIKKIEDAYYGKEQRRFRIQFKIPLPVLPGMVDSLKDAFDDEVSMKYGEDHPADYGKIQKYQAAFDKQVSSLRSNARWPYKTRVDKFLAILSGRGIQKTYAESDPEFNLHFNIIDYRYFHCEPKGGGLLQPHLFQGEEGLFRTKESIVKGIKSKWYDLDASKMMINSGKDPDHKNEMENIYGDKLNRFTALGLNPENNNYTGQTVFNLCEWFLVYKGKLVHLIFDPWTKQPLRCVPLKEDFGFGLTPYTSWATHEDPKVFWSKGYCDDFLVAHETLGVLLNQELTNRQKSNMTPKFYDKGMISGQALDRSQYEHDAIVGVDTKNGTRKISEGVYQFQVKELGTATVDMSDWLMKTMQSLTGTQDISDQANMKVGAQVAYSRLQSAAKRLSHRAKSFQEAYAEAGLRAFYGFKEHMSEPIAIKVMGIKGYGWDYLTRDDLNLEGETPDPKVISKSEEDELNVMGKEQKSKAIDKVLANQTLTERSNPDELLETIYKDVGGFTDEKVKRLMDKDIFTSKTMAGKADIAILQLCRGKDPEVVYDCDTSFLQRIEDFRKDHKNELGDEKDQAFSAYIQKHIPIATANMARLAVQIMQQKKMQPQQPGQGQQQPQQQKPSGPINPQVKMSPMQMGGAQ